MERGAWKKSPVNRHLPFVPRPIYYIMSPPLQLGGRENQFLIAFRPTYEKYFHALVILTFCNMERNMLSACSCRVRVKNFGFPRYSRSRHPLKLISSRRLRNRSTCCSSGTAP